MSSNTFTQTALSAALTLVVCLQSLLAADVPPARPVPAAEPKQAAADKSKGDKEKSTQDSKTNAPPALRLEARRSLSGGVDYGTHATMTAGTNKFGFGVPAGWLLRADPSGRRFIVSDPDSRITIVITHVDAQTLPKGKFEPQAAIDSLLVQLPGTRLISTYDTAVMSTNGIIAEIAFPAASTPTRGKFALVPTAGGYLQLHCISPIELQEAAFGLLGEILSSFQAAGPDGKIAFPQPSPTS